jgi:predicted aspartyl protease
MGQVHVSVTLHNTRELVLAQLGHLAPAQIHAVETEALVETGAMHLVVPPPLAEQLGLVELGTQDVTMADGRDGVYPQTEPVTVELLGRSYALSALVMGHTVLFGGHCPRRPSPLTLHGSVSSRIWGRGITLSFGGKRKETP